MKRVYLSGGMEYAEGEGAQWRGELQRWIEAELRHSVFNPNVESGRFFAERHPDTDVRKLKEQDVQRYADIIRQLVDLDCREIAHRADYVICYWDDSAARGAGTKGELTMARFFDKPVYLVTDRRIQDIPGWVLGCTTRIFPGFAELKSFLQAGGG